MVDVNEIKNYEFISFDIFDTLIKRNCICPRDVFSIVQDTYNSDSKEKIFNFLSNRVNSELQARKLTNNEEIEFDEIYFYLEKYYSAEICKKLKQIEIETELNICQSNNEMNKILQYCIENNKKIILTSDMYLDKSIIEKILDKNNIKYHKLFLSSDFKVKKGSGNLFLKILDDLNIDKSKLIHIGDNYKSDYLIPKQLGIASIHYVKKSNNSYYNNIIKNNLSSNVLSSFITNNLKDNEKKLYDWGYICFGPVLYGFTKWLIKNLKKENINKVYFLARDGYIMKKAFDAINTNTDIKSYYFYASRRSIIVPSLWCCKKINEIYDLMYGVNRLSLDKFIKRLGLEDFDLSKEIKKFKLNLKHVYSIEYMKTNQDFCNFMNEIYDKIINNSKKEYFYMEKYLQNVDFKGKVAIVDIGWCGNMQMALSKVVGNEIHGYYVGIKKNQSKLKMKGFLFDNEHDKNIYSNIDRNAGIFEFPFLV